MPKQISFKNHTGPPVKRKRIITSCSNCRKRKIKCDKTRPVCQMCSKSKKSSDTCSYQEPSWNESMINVSSNYVNAASVPMAHIGVESTNESPTDQSTLPTNQKEYPHSDNLQTPIITNPTISKSNESYRSNSQSSINSRHDEERTMKRSARTNSFGHSQSSSTSAASPSIPLYTPGTKLRKLQYMSFYDYEEPVSLRAGRLITAGPLSLPSLLKKDPFLKVNLLSLKKQQKHAKHYWAHIRLKHSKDLVKEIIIEDKNGLNNRLVDERFKKTLIENEGIDEIKNPLETSNGNDKMISSKSHVFNLNSQDYEAQTIKAIQDVLPDEKLIWILLDKYFNGLLSAFMPVLSEGPFKERMVDILGPRKDRKEKIETIQLSKRFDFAFVGILLIIIRLTSLSVTKTSNNTPQEKYILDNPIGLNAVNVAQMCLNQFKLLRRGAMPIIQCCLFMRFYHKYAPEDGDGSDGGDGQVFLGMLLQMANSIGLNRDLNHSASLRDDLKLTNIWRIIWHEIVTLDLKQSFSLGAPILIDENYYDTLLPSLERKVSEHTAMNYEIHSSTIKNIHVNDQINQIVRDILKMVLSIKNMVNVEDLLPKLIKLENFISDNFKSMKDILMMKSTTLPDSVEKLYQFINYIELKTSLHVIYYHITLRFPGQYHSLFIKMIEISLELNPLTYLMITTNNQTTNYFDSVFGAGSQLIILPTLITSFQKTHQVQCGIISRSLDIIFNHKDFKHYGIVKKIYEEMLKKFELVKDGFQSLSSDYFHAWRTSKATNLLVKFFSDLDNCIWDKDSIISKTSLNDSNSKNEINPAENIPKENELLEITEYELNEILEIITSSQHGEVLMLLLNRVKSNKDTEINQSNLNNNNNDQYGYENLSTIYPEHAQYQSLTYTPLPKTPTISTAKVNNNTNTGTSIEVQSYSPYSKSSHIPNAELHVNKNLKTNVEIDRLWIQMLSNNNGNNGNNIYNSSTPDNISVTSSIEKSTNIDSINNNNVNTNNNNTTNQTNPNNAQGPQGPQTQTQTQTQGSNYNFNIFDTNSLGLEGFDLDKLVGGASLYDIFGDIP